MQSALANLAMREKAADFFRDTNAEIWALLLKRRAGERGYRETAARIVADEMRAKRKRIGRTIAPRTVERYFDAIENDPTLTQRRADALDSLALAFPDDWRERRQRLRELPIFKGVVRHAVWPEESDSGK